MLPLLSKQYENTAKQKLNKMNQNQENVDLDTIPRLGSQMFININSCICD